MNKEWIRRRNRSGIIIVDNDHPVVREGIRALLSREIGFEVCGDAGTAAEALELVRKSQPHVAVVDVLLDNENGLDLIRSINRCNRNVKVLACSMYDDRLYAEGAARGRCAGLCQ